MIPSRAATLLLAFATGSLVTFTAVALSLSPVEARTPRMVVAEAFDAVAAMPAQAPALREALDEAARGDLQPILRTDRSVRLVTIERHGNGVSALIRVPAGHGVS